MALVQGLVDKWNYLLESGDVRSNQLPFIQSPLVPLVAIVLYLAMIALGPRIMEKRVAWKLKEVLIGYNLFCVLLSLWMMYEFIACSFFKPGFNLVYEKFDETDTSDMTMRMVWAHWVYFASKIIEFMDTFFFIVRKKDNQLSFLHVYHHVSMVLLQWGMVKFVPGAASYLGPIANSFIHAVMYGYYLLSAFGPHMQKFLWWKKYLTRMQMTQFIVVFLYCTSLINQDLSGPARFFSWAKWIYMITLFGCFNHFYQNAYKKKKAE